jgi:hypothetical protein
LTLSASCARRASEDARASTPRVTPSCARLFGVERFVAGRRGGGRFVRAAGAVRRWATRLTAAAPRTPRERRDDPDVPPLGGSASSVA